MCLITQDKFKCKSMIGYKLVRYIDGEYHNAFTGVISDFTYGPPGFEIDDSSKTIIHWSDVEYKTGFHVFKKLEDAKWLMEYLSMGLIPYRIIKVRLSDLVAKGQNDTSDEIGFTYVGRHMEFIEEVVV